MKKDIDRSEEVSEKALPAAFGGADKKKASEKQARSSAKNADSEKAEAGKKQRGFKEKLRFLWKDKRRFSARLITALLAALAFDFTFFVFGPFDIYCNNMQYFVFGLKYMTTPVVLVALAIFVVLTGLLCLLKGKIFNYAVSLVFSLTAAGYVQGMIDHHGALNGEAIKWTGFKAPALLGLALWAAAVIVPIAIQYFSRKVWKTVIRLGSVLIVSVQVVALVFLLVTSAFGFSNISDNGYLTNEGLYELSQKKNVVVFILDRFDKRYADEQFRRDGELEKMFSGFTFYDNFTGSYSRTFPSLTYLLTGKQYKYDVTSDEYFRQAWNGRNVLEDISNSGYETKLYTEVRYVVGTSENVKGKVLNLGEPTHAANPAKILSAMYGLSAYRYLPEALKPFFYIYTGDISYEYMYGDNNIYALDDAAFYRELMDDKLSVKDGSKGSFIFYHLKGSHEPYTMDENGNVKTFADRNLGRIQQTKGDLNMIKHYIQFMKDKGVYDDSTIIVTADHGETGRLTDLKKAGKPRFPSLFIKPAHAKDEPMRRSHKQICQDNLRSSILSYFGLDYTKYPSPCPEYSYPRTIEEIGEDEDMVRYFWMSAVSDLHIKRDSEIVTYEIRGNANDLGNYTEISRDKIAIPYYKAW